MDSLIHSACNSSNFIQTIRCLIEIDWIQCIRSFGSLRIAYFNEITSLHQIKSFQWISFHWIWLIDSVKVIEYYNGNQINKKYIITGQDDAYIVYSGCFHWFQFHIVLYWHQLPSLRQAISQLLTSMN